MLAGVVAAAAAFVAAPAAHAQIPTFYSVPYSNELFVYMPSFQQPVAVDYGYWQFFKFPAPTPVQIQVYGYSWVPDLWVVASFPRGEVVKRLTFEDWARTGFRPPRPDRLLPNTEIFAYNSSSELFADNSERDIRPHKLTLAEWTGMGQPRAVYIDQGFLRLSWAPENIATVVRVPDPWGSPSLATYLLSFEEWEDAGYPTPRDTPAMQGDQVCAVTGTDELWFLGLAYSGPLTFEQWAGSGFLSPNCSLDAPPA